MPPGDLITQPGQAEIRGLLIGRATPYAVQTWEGLGLPEVADNDQEFDGDDGSSAGFDRYPKRSISASIGITAANRDELGVRRDALAAAMRRAGGPAETVPFVIRLSATPRRFHVRPRRLELPWERFAEHGLMLSGALMVEALDPYGYSTTEHLETITIADDETTASAVIDNAGNGRTRPTLEITGPATDPVVANLETGRAARFVVTLGSSDVLEVDVASGIMLLNGSRVWVGASDYEVLELAPGTQELSFTRTGGGIPATCDVRWRDGWLSA